MDNFEILKHYTIPSDVLMDMLSTYRLLGMNLEYEEKIKDQAKYLRNEVIEKDTERDHYMTAEEALKYGLIDGIMEKRK